MRNTLAVAAREVEERRFVTYAAAAFAVLPFILAMIPRVSGRSPREVIALSAMSFAAMFTLGLAMILGASLLGRDLSDGRMSFFFSRPLSASSIWFGKLAASLALLAGCFALIAVPSWVVAHAQWQTVWTLSFGDTAAYVLGAAVALLLIAHVVSTVVRSHSPMLALDFVAAVGCGLAIAFLMLQLARGLAFHLMGSIGVALTIAFAVAIAAAGAWQLARGRIDRRRNHRALSQFLWSAIALVLLLSAAYVTWVASMQPADLTTHVYAHQAASGPLAALSGVASGRGDYQAAFLLNSEDHNVVRIDPRAIWSLEYARDGKHALWAQPERGYQSIQISTAGGPGADTGLTFAGGYFFVSDDATRVATYSKDLISIYDVATKRTLLSARLPAARNVRAFFVNANVLRLYLRTDDGWKIYEVATDGGGVQMIGQVEANQFVTSTDATGSRMLVLATLSRTYTLRDARTGAIIAPLAITTASGARFLRDGRIGIISGEPLRVLHVLDMNGSVLREVTLGSSADRGARIVGDDGSRVVCQVGSELVVANIEHGVIERRERASGFINWTADPRPPLGPLRELFVFDRPNHVVEWNPATGVKRMITGS